MLNFYQYNFKVFLILLFVFGCRSKKIDFQNNNTLSLDNSIVNIKENDDLFLDSDGDGVVNKFDLESNTPNGISVDEVGRSLDLDSDGVPDYIDDDPFSTFGAFVDKNGRELDGDGDGIPNNKDLDLKTKIGSCVNNKGQLIDCKKAVLPSIYFNPNSSKVEDFNLDRLQVISSLIRNNLNYKLRVVGFFDLNGLESYSFELDLKRAESVIQVLSNIFGVELDRMEVYSKTSYNQLDEKMFRKVQFELF